jgi:protein ImuA
MASSHARQHDASSDPASGADKPDLTALRRQVRAIERGGREEGGDVLPFGLPAVDDCLPGGLPLACLHEMTGPDAGGLAGLGPAIGFAAALAATIARRRNRPVLWLAPRLTLYPPGLAAYGLTPDRLLVARAVKPADLLWALEEAARSPSLAAIIAQDVRADLTASRRLQLAAEAGGATPLLLNTAQPAGATNAATTRWHITPAPGQPRPGEDAWPGLADPVWHVALQRCRAGRPGAWRLLWRDGEWSFVAAGQDRQAGPSRLARPRAANANAA